MGHSERLVGKSIAGRRDKVLIATKCGVRWDLEEGLRARDVVDNDGKACAFYRNSGQPRSNSNASKASNT